MSEIKLSEVCGTPALDRVYISEMDMWPLEGEDFNRNFQFYNNLREGRFTTTKCKKCGHIAFPPGVICPGCWSESPRDTRYRRRHPRTAAAKGD